MRDSFSPIVTRILVCVAVLALPDAASTARGAPSADGPDPDQVVRLRVTEETLDSWFPGRVGLTAMPADRFDRLAEQARLATIEAERARPLEPNRIEHRVRLEGSELVGRTTLRFPSPGGSTRWATLSPWSPAIESVSPESNVLVHRDRDGRAFLRLDPGDDPDGPLRSVEISWGLRPRVEAEGRIFDLELVEGPATALILDLPEGVTPSGPPGYREGPEPTGEPGRNRWRFDGPGGSVVLRLRSAPDPDRPSGPWISGASLVEVDAEGPGAVRWATAWEIDPGSDGHRPLRIRLAPGMSWDEVIGPEGAVSGVEVRPEADGTLLTVRWRDGLIGPTRLSLSGLATIDDPTRWRVPAVEPVDAQWLGGPVVVWLDRSWSLVDSAERSGRRLDLDEVPAESWEAIERALVEVGRRPEPEDIPALSPEPGRGGLPLAFFADRPESVAELHLAPAPGIVSASVRGTVRLRDGADSLEAAIDLDSPTGSAELLTLELSAGWVPDAVRAPDGQGAPRWEQEILDDGRRLIRVHLPATRAGDGAPSGSRPPDLIVSATILTEDARTMSLPRVRPIGPAVAEERWSVVAGPRVALRPTEARGLAWLDLSTTASRGSPSPDELREILAWRWVSAVGFATVTRGAESVRPSAVIVQRVTISGGRLAIEWDVQLDSLGEDLRSFPYRIRPEQVGAAGPSWSLIGADGEESRPIPIDLSVDDEAELRLPSDPSGTVSLRARLDLPWPGEGVLPMLDLPRRFETRGTVSLRVESSLRCETRGDLSFREMGSATASPAAEAGPTAPSTRLVESFLFDGRPGELAVRTTPLPPTPSEGVILRAALSSVSAPDGTTRHRLAMDVVADDSATLGVALPDGAELEAVSSDGEPVLPFVSGEMIRIPLARPDAEGSPPASSGRPRRVVIDSHSSTTAGPVREAAGPRFSMPCLSFSWRVDGPTDRTLSAVGPALIPADPGPDRRGWLPGFTSRRLANLTAPERVMLSQLDERAAAVPVAGLRLGDLLASWDVGRWPIVVDRSALEAIGLGPRAVMPAGARLDAGAPAGSARKALAPVGLVAVPIDTVLLITTFGEAPRVSVSALGSGPDREAWVRSLREAVAWGADRSDRFRTLERWRATPALVSAGPVAAPGGPGVDPRAVRRFVAPGWPAEGAWIRSIDRWPWLASGGAIGLLMVMGGSARLPGRGWRAARIGLLGLVVILSAAVASRGGPRLSSLAIGPFYGAVVGLIVAAIRSRPRPIPDESTASTMLRSRGSTARIGVGSAGSLALIASIVVAQPTTVGQAVTDPVIALISEATPETVFLRDSDLRRLRIAADRGPIDEALPEWPSVGAVRSSHHLKPDPEGSDAWILETRLSLRFEEAGPAVWSLPIGRPTDLEATFDGRPRPVLIDATPDRATVAIDGEEGLHELVIRQRVLPESDATGRRLAIPINPVASASLRVGIDPDGPDPILTRSLGPLTIGPDGELRAEIGPSDRVEVRWESDAEGGDAEGLRVEALLLWRALPSSDLLDARLTFRGTGPIREAWFAIEPGVAVRSVRAEGAVVEASRLIADDGDRWIARIDPPLPQGGTLRLELRRDRPGAGDEAAPPATELRRPPLLEPMGVDRYEGRIALMRPKSWGGRIEPGAGDPPTSEQQFEQDWGPLPRGAALDPAGAVRFSGGSDVPVRIGPADVRRAVEPRLQLDLDSGRWEWRLAAEVADLDGRAVREVPIGLPDDLEVIDVEGPGLTGWDRPSRDRLLLRFDGPSASTRSIAINGWIPQVPSPMEPGPMVAERPLPWPEWPGAEAEEGSLLLSSPTTTLIDYRDADGSPRPLDRLATSNNRRRYRPIQVRTPGTLRIESFPAVTVELWSQLVLGSRSARWEALVRYRVAGGPADRIELILPESWARAAEYELDGRPPIGVRDRGDRIEIDPGRPIWGSTDLRIRSVLPLEGDQPLSFPDLNTWGLGTVSGHTIALVVPVDRAPTLEYSGLAPADTATRDQLLNLFPTPLPPDADRKFYRVQPGGWSLLIQPPPASRVESDDLGKTRVDLANLTGVVDPAGTVRGHAVFDLQPNPGPFLSLAAPPGGEALASVVDGRAVRPQVGPEGGWIIPLGDGPARRVELVWIDPMASAAAEPRAGRRFFIPQPFHDGATVLTTIRAAEADSVSASGGSTLPIPAATQLVEQVERAADRLGSRLERLGPSIGPPDRESLTAELARFLALQRQTERSAYWAALMMRDSAEVDRQRGPLRRVLAARESVDAALQSAGLSDLIDAIPSQSDPGPPTDFLAPLQPGLPRHFRAETEADRPISFDWSPGGVG